MEGFGPCSGSITKEHFVSRNILAYGAKERNEIRFGGMHWQPPMTLQSIGVDNLGSKMLCEGHNSGMSHLDTCAGHAFRAFDDVDKRPTAVPKFASVEGEKFELWFLKVVCGLHAAQKKPVADAWRQVLAGGPWPQGWGLYFQDDIRQTIAANALEIRTLVDPSGQTLAARFYFAGVHLNLLLGVPDLVHRWGVWHPPRLVFKHEGKSKCFDFTWIQSSGRKVRYIRVGSTKEGPPEFDDWIQGGRPEKKRPT